MNRRVFISAAPAIAFLAGCRVFGRVYDLRYRLKVAVITDGVVHQGTSVIAVRWSANGKAAGFDGVPGFHCVRHGGGADDRSGSARFAVRASAAS